MSGRVRPIVVLLAAVACGICASAFLTLSAFALVAVALCGLLAGLFLLQRNHRASLYLFALTFACIGWGRAHEAFTPGSQDISRYNDGPNIRVYGMFTAELDVGEQGAASGYLAVRAAGDRAATGTIRVTLAPDAYGRRAENLPEPGETFWLQGQLTTPLPATNPGGFDYRAYLARRSVFSQMLVRRPTQMQRVQPGEAAPVARTASVLRHAVRRTTAAHLKPPDAALLDGLLLSVRTTLAPEVDEAFSRTGTVHILSVSGLHLVALAWCLALLFRGLSLPPLPANLISITLLWIFVLAAGASDAAVRSAVMASLVLAAPLVRRSAEPLHSLCAAALGILLVSPGSLYDAGFQLSFAATGTLLLWAPPLARLLLPPDAVPTRPGTLLTRYVLLPLLVGVIAEAGSAPLVAYHFNRFSLIGPIANLPIALLTEILLLLGLSAAALTPPLGILTLPLWIVLGWGLELLRQIVLAFAALPFASYSIVSPPASVILIYYALLVGSALLVRARVMRRILFAPHAAVPVAPAGAAAGVPSAAALPDSAASRNLP